MPRKKSSRIVIDTNLWISFLISKRHDIIEKIIFNENIILLFSAELIEEINSTIHKPALRKYFGVNALNEMLYSVQEFSELISVKTKIAISRDPKDNFLINLAYDGNADYLLTGDKDLLVLKKYKRIKIITVSEYISANK